MIRLEGVLEMSWRRFCKTYWRRFEDALKTFWQGVFEDVLKTSSKRLEDEVARRLENVLKKSWQEVMKTSWTRLENVWPRRIHWSWPRRLKDVLKTSSGDTRLRRTYLSWWRHVLRTSSEDEDERRLHQDECFLGINFLIAREEWWM